MHESNDMLKILIGAKMAVFLALEMCIHCINTKINEKIRKMMIEKYV